MSADSLTANDELAALVASRQESGYREPKESAAEKNTQPCLLMRMGERWCALRAESVREVVAVGSITGVPGQLPHILGVVLVHGRLVPVIDLCRLADSLEMTLEVTPGRRLIVLATEDIELGIIADDAKAVIELPMLEDDKQNLQSGDFILGEVQWEEQLVCVMDTARLIQAAVATERS